MNLALDRLRAAIPADIDGVLVHEITNVGWLTGFSGSSGRVIATRDDAVFVTDSRYAIQADEEVKSMPTEWFQAPVEEADFLAEQVAKRGIRRLAFDPEAVTFGVLERWRAKFGGVELVSVPSLYAGLRMAKFEPEIASIRKACGIADAAFAHIQRLIQPGVSELDICLDLEFFIRRQGAGVAFPSIVVSGERSARPHGTPSDKKLADGDFVTFDFGARVDGYNSDITRTVVVGTATDRHREIYDQVRKANEECIAAMRPGVPAAEVDALARRILDEKGLAKYFGHGLGHGLGRLVHDSGRLSATSKDVLEEGQVWTVEPGVYVPGFGGVRIEDDVVVRADGVEVLTHSTKELLELPAR